MYGEWGCEEEAIMPIGREAFEPKEEEDLVARGKMRDEWL